MVNSESKSGIENNPIDITDAQCRLKSGQLSAVELIEGFLSAAQKQRHLNVFITETFESAQKQAVEADNRIKSGNARPLEGIPIAVKDNFCTNGIKTTAGSKILHNFTPTYESTITKKLWDAGAILVGKTNLDEFAMGSTTESSYFGPTINPFGERLGYTNLSPGGSSGGSAAAVASGMALGAIGSDTGGSVRQPASFCGLVGMKPTYGLCSRWGIMAYASSLDQAGVFGKTVKDMAIIMDTIIGHDELDSTSTPRGNINPLKACNGQLGKLKIAIPKEIREHNSTKDADLVWDKAEKLAMKLNAELVPVSMPNLKYALPAYYIIALSEASSNLARYDGVRFGHRAENFDKLNDMYERTRTEGFGKEVFKRIMMGTYSLSSGYYDAYYKKAQQVRRIVSNEFKEAFEVADLMFMPTVPTGASELGAATSDPLQMYLEDIFTVPINMAGVPACSVPVANDNRGMPLGLQIIGPRFSDNRVISLANMIENEIVTDRYL